jgi:soluble lytic murein transglycosylase
MTLKIVNRFFEILLLLLFITSCSLIRPIVIKKQYSIQDVKNAISMGNYGLAYKESKYVNTSGMSDEWLIKYKFMLAFVSYQTEHYKEAQEYFKQLLSDKTRVPDYVNWYLAKSYEKTGDCNSSMEYLKFIADNFTESVFLKPSLQLMGQCMTKMKKYNNAINLYSEYITNSSFYRQLPEILTQRAALYVSTGNTRSGINDYLKVYSLFPNSSYAGIAFSALNTITDVTSLNIDHCRIANLLMMDNEYTAALNELNIAIPEVRLSGNNNKISNLYKNMGIAYYYTDQYNDAILALQTSLYYNTQNHDYPEILFWLGKCFTKYGKTDYAINTFLQLAYIKSNYKPMALYKLYALYQKEGNTIAAQRWLLKLANTNTPFSLTAYWNLAWYYYKAGDFKGAIYYLKKMEHSKYSDEYEKVKAEYWSARILLKDGETGKANTMFFKIANTMPLNYYSLMSNMWIGVNTIAYNVNNIYTPKIANMDSSFNFHYSRYVFLKGLGINKESLNELAALSMLNLSQNECLLLCYEYYINGDYFHSLYIARTELGDMLQTFTSDTLPVWFYSYPTGYSQIINNYTVKYDIDPFILYALILQESRYKTDAVSNAGALGIMQIMPSTASKVAKEISLEPFSSQLLLDPQINIGIGTWYFKKLTTKYKGNYVLSLAAYNAGERAVDTWLAHSTDCDTDEFIEDIPFEETRHYVKGIIANLAAYTKIYGGKINLEKHIYMEGSFLKSCLPKQ